MNRLSLLISVLPACVGVTLVQASLGWPLTSGAVTALRVVFFGLWFVAVLCGILLGQRSADRARARTHSWVLMGATLLAILTAALVLGMAGASTQTQVGITVVLLGGMIWRLGERWICSAMANAGILVIGLGLAGSLLSLGALRGWTGLIAGVGGGSILLGQAVWSGVRGGRRY